MDSYQLIINGVNIPISEEAAGSIALNLSITDISEPEKRKADYTKDFSLPSSKEINKEFAYAFEIDTDLNDTTFNPYKKVDCTLTVNSSVMIDGYIRLKQIVKLGAGDYEYKVNIFGRLANLVTDIGDGYINEIDFSDLDHDWTKANITNSWDTSYQLNGSPQAFAVGSGYVYSLIDYGFDNDEETYDVAHLFPAIYQREYLLRMFNDAGYTWNSTFLDSDYFKRRIIPYSGGAARLTQTQVNDRLAIGQYTGPTSYTVADTPANFDNLTLTATQDNLSQISTDEIIVDQDGYYDLTFELNYNVDFTHPAPATAVTTNGYVYLVTQLRVDTTGTGSSFTAVHALQREVRADGSFIADYSTDINSLPNNPEYQLFNVSQALNVMTNPASVMIDNKTNIYLPAGSIVRYRTFYSFNNIAQAFQQVADPSIYYDGTGLIDLNVQALDLRLKSRGAKLIEGNSIDMAGVVPKDIKKKDLLTTIIREHNLFIEPSLDNPYELNIEPRNDYYGSSVVNWTDKLDLSREVEYDVVIANKYNKYIFTNKEDKDYYNTLYKDSYDETYGTRVIDIDNDFVSATKKVESIF